MIWQDRIRTNPYKRKITYSNGTSEEVSIEEIEGNVTLHQKVVFVVTFI